MIFLVDDDPIQNMLTSKLIETADATTEYRVFQNGEEAIQAIDAKSRPEIILLDINMPIMDGWEFLDAYSSYRNKAKVYILTSSNMQEDRNKAEEYDCIAGYLTKPIGLAQIKEILE